MQEPSGEDEAGDECSQTSTCTTSTSQERLWKRDGRIDEDGQSHAPHSELGLATAEAQGSGQSTEPDPLRHPANDEARGRGQTIDPDPTLHLAEKEARGKDKAHGSHSLVALATEEAQGRVHEHVPYPELPLKKNTAQATGQTGISAPEPSRCAAEAGEKELAHVPYPEVSPAIEDGEDGPIDAHVAYPPIPEEKPTPNREGSVGAPACPPTEQAEKKSRSSKRKDSAKGKQHKVEEDLGLESGVGPLGLGLAWLTLTPAPLPREASLPPRPPKISPTRPQLEGCGWRQQPERQTRLPEAGGSPYQSPGRAASSVPQDAREWVLYEVAPLAPSSLNPESLAISCRCFHINMRSGCSALEREVGAHLAWGVRKIGMPGALDMDQHTWDLCSHVWVHEREAEWERAHICASVCVRECVCEREGGEWKEGREGEGHKEGAGDCGEGGEANRVQIWTGSHGRRE
jgi:hypothetical protein